MGGHFGLMAFLLILMGKFALSYEQIEVRARLRNELNAYIRVPLHYRKRLLRVVIDYAPGILLPVFGLKKVKQLNWLPEHSITQNTICLQIKM